MERYATVSIEPQGKRFAARYDTEHETEALRELDTMPGILVLRRSDETNWNELPEWTYRPGVGWVQ